MLNGYFLLPVLDSVYCAVRTKVFKRNVLSLHYDSENCAKKLITI